MQTIAEKNVASSVKSYMVSKANVDRGQLLQLETLYQIITNDNSEMKMHENRRKSLKESLCFELTCEQTKNVKPFDNDWKMS